MAKGKIGFDQEAPVDELRVKYSWDRKIGNVTVTYSTEGVIGVGFNHNCDVRHGSQSTRVTTIQTTAQLTRDEVQRRFALAKDVSEFISQMAGAALT
jgi:hypothetical protein